MKRNIYDAMSGEWLDGLVEDYHEPLPAHDPYWMFMQGACLLVVWGSLIGVVLWGAP